MASAAGAVYVDVKANTKQFEQSMGSLGTLADKLFTAASATALARFAKQCTDLASELTELQNVVDQVFPTMSAKLDDWSQGLISTFGLSEAKAKHYAGTMASMARSMGFTEEQAYAMSTSLAELAGDVASFYDMSSDEAFSKLESVFTGMVQPLRSLGINMTQASLDAYALANGWGKTTDEMSEAEMTLLRYQYVLDRTQFAQGDAARTSGTWANQVRQLQMNFESLEATLGAQLVDSLLPALTTINSMITSLDSLLERFNLLSVAAGALGTLFPGLARMQAVAATNGMVDRVGKLDKALAKTNRLTQAAAESTGGLAAAHTGAAGSAGSQGSAVQKLNRILAGFDRINKLASSSASGGSGGGGGGGGYSAGVGSGLLDGLLGDEGNGKIADFKRYNFKIDNRERTAERFQSAFSKNGGGNIARKLENIWTDEDGTTLEKLQKSAQAIGKAIRDRLHGGGERILTRSGGSNLGRGIVGNILGKQAPLAVDGGSVAELADMWGSITDKTAKLTAETAGKDKVEALKTPYDSIKDKLAKLTGRTEGEAKVSALSNTIAATKDKTATLTGKVGTTAEAVKSKWSSIIGDNWKDKTSTLGRTFSSTATKESVAGSWKARIGNVWKSKSATLSRAFSDGVSKASMETSWKARIGDQWKNKTATLGRAFAETATAAKVKGEWRTRIDAAWKGKDAPLTATDNVTSVIAAVNKTALNNHTARLLVTEDQVTGKIDAANKTALKNHTAKLLFTPELTKSKINVYSKGASSYSLEFLAQGGYVERNTPRLAVIGDNRYEGEIVSPESKFQTMLDKAASQGGSAETVRMLGLILAAVQGIDPNVYIDSRDVTRAVVTNINRQVQSTGRSPLLV